MYKGGRFYGSKIRRGEEGKPQRKMSREQRSSAGKTIHNERVGGNQVESGLKVVQKKEKNRQAPEGLQ